MILFPSVIAFLYPILPSTWLLIVYIFILYFHILIFILIVYIFIVILFMLLILFIVYILFIFACDRSFLLQIFISSPNVSKLCFDPVDFYNYLPSVAVAL